MKNLSSEEIYKIVMPRLSTMRKCKGQLSLSHIITVDHDDRDYTGSLCEMFINEMESACDELNIKYRSIILNDNRSLIFDRIKNTIIEANKNYNSDGVLYDFPFELGSAINVFKKYIDTDKDIGFFSEQTYFKYNNNNYIMSPFVFCEKSLRHLHGITDNPVSYSIIGNRSTYNHKGLIPFNNIEHNVYTYTNQLNNYVKSFNNDVIISLMMNINKKSIIYRKLYNRKYNPLLVIDFGYHDADDHIEFNSLDLNYFSIDTPYYTWQNSLIRLYVYGVINNLLSK